MQAIAIWDPLHERRLPSDIKQARQPEADRSLPTVVSVPVLISPATPPEKARKPTTERSGDEGKQAGKPFGDSTRRERKEGKRPANQISLSEAAVAPPAVPTLKLRFVLNAAAPQLTPVEPAQAEDAKQARGKGKERAHDDRKSASVATSEVPRAPAAGASSAGDKLAVGSGDILAAPAPTVTQ